MNMQYSKLTWQEKIKVREGYVKSQDGLCLYCKEDLNEEAPKRITDKKIIWSKFPPNFLKYRIHLQHNHKTDECEGAVHAYCNAVMWQYEGK